MRRATVLFILLIFYGKIAAQTSSNTEKFDSSFVFSIIKDKKDTVTAIFSWITDNIAYDVAALTKKNKFTSQEAALNAVFKDKKGVCGDYSMLFAAFCNKVNIKNYIVEGYTINRKEEDTLHGHTWNVVRINNKWRLFDPTWAAGSVGNDRFYKEYSAKWFATPPEEFIKTHIPFDPVWQLLDFPLSKFDILARNKNAIEKIKTEKIDFETIISKDYGQKKRDMEQISQRIIAFSDNNALAKREIVSFQKNINIDKENTNIDTYNQCVAAYNTTVNHYNQLRHSILLLPLRKQTDTTILEWQKTMDENLKKTLELLEAVHSSNPDLQKQVNEHKVNFVLFAKNVKKMSAYTNRFLKTWKPLRGFVIFTYEGL